MTRVRIRVDFTPGCSVGPGKIELLEAIAVEGSLSAAARRIGMSYRRAWLLVEALNASFRDPVTAASIGGRGGGGVALTAFGERLVRDFRAFEGDVDRLAARRWRSLAAVARRTRPAGRAPARRPSGKRRPRGPR